jgi:dTMP kinase
MAARGYFVVFEGGEGAGKSTQEGLLAAALEAAGRTVVRTREPGGTPAAELIRHVVLSPEFEGLDARAEALLFAAARGEHVARVVRPALERGDVVICDRYIDSSVAYQGIARDLGEDRIRDLSLWATGGLLPDVTIVLDVDPEVGLARFAQRDRLEAEPLDYHEDVRVAYLALAAAEPERYLVVDARSDVDAIAEAILARVRQGLESS